MTGGSWYRHEDHKDAKENAQSQGNRGDGEITTLKAFDDPGVGDGNSDPRSRGYTGDGTDHVG